MQQEKYWNSDGCLYRDLDREDDGTPIDEIGRYEIIFEFREQRYYCFVDAVSLDEALGNFFRNHDTVEYQNIVDHMEIQVIKTQFGGGINESKMQILLKQRTVQQM